MVRISRASLAAMACVIVALALSACGSNSSSSSGSSSKSSSPKTAGGLAQTGPGLTAPTTGSGTKVNGGTVYFSEAPGSPPNYIFPMYSAQYCGTNNIDQLNIVLYRPLYWYGNNYSPKVDPAQSVGQTPVVSNGGKTYTIHLNDYKWSNGEQVTSRDLVFWMNVLEANPATEWCGSVPGLFPFDVKSYTAPNPTTFVLTMKKAYNPTWMLYNELSQIYPLPLAWDRTSLSQPAPTKDNGHLPDTTKAGAAAVYAFLNKQGADTATWSTSPLWSVVDGPFKLQSFTTAGQLTMVPNPDYSGTPKPSISKLVEEPFTSDTALFNEVRASGPSALTVTQLPAQDTPQKSAVEAEGYDVNTAAYYGVNFFPLNFNNPKVGPVFRQLYFRQAFQHLIDQPGWINAYLGNAAVPTYGPVPTSPPSPLVSAGSGGNPYPFSVSAASTLLTSNGWKVVPGGNTTCAKPGTGAGECGAGVTAGEAIAFNLDYESGVQAVQEEMTDLQADAKKVGIEISLTTHQFDQVYSAAVHCTPNQAKCGWTAENWGAGWIYGPDYLPTGEDLFAGGSVANYSNYNDPTENKLITDTITGPAADETTAMSNFVNNTEKQLPVVFEPTSIGTFGANAGTLISSKLGGYSANALGFMTPEFWYLTK
jgi:peptide/nickel transport system substrate-binding protein